MFYVDDGDTHILATAITGEADILATDNTPDFEAARDWMQEHSGIRLMEHGELLAMLFTEYPEPSVDVHRYLLTGNYAAQGQQHMLDTMRRATKTAEMAIEALENALVDLDDHEDNVQDIEAAMTVAYSDGKERIAERQREAAQRLGSQDIRWVGPVTRKDGTFVAGYWQRR